MDILIINLTRMGDIIQSTPLMEGLKENYPGCSITYIANEPYAEVCEGIPFIDNLITFNMEGYQRRVLSPSTSLIDDYIYLDAFLSEVNKRSYDLLINLTPSRICAVMTSLINAKEIMGLTIDGEGHRLIKDLWTRYLATSVFNRKLNPFNLCDMYVKIGGVEHNRKGLFLKVPKDSEHRAIDLLREAGVKEDDLIIGFQPGASKEHKRWGVEGFAGLGRRLSEGLGAKIMIFGSKEEQSLGKRIKEVVGDNAIDMTGRTKVLELAALLKKCRLLVTNDSGTMHIATAVGTKVVELSLGAAYFRETGPYGEGNIVIESQIPCHPCNFHIECKEMVCRDYIKADGVYKVLEMVLNGEINTTLKDLPFLKDIQVYKSFFDEEGFLCYIPIIPRSIGKKELFLFLYKEMWKRVLCGRVSFYNPWELKRILKGSLRDFLSITPQLRDELMEDLRLLKELHLLSEKGNLLLDGLLRCDTNSSLFLDHAKKVDEELSSIDERIKSIGFLSPSLNPLITIFNYGKEGLEGEGILSLAKEIQQLYQDLKKETSIMIQFIEELISSSHCIGDKII